MAGYVTTGRAASIPISFYGTAGSYFTLFISNLLLTIITLGFYSPWARVRTRRYFMGYTYLGEHNIDFDASPLSILVARIIIVTLFGLFYIATAFEEFWLLTPIIFLVLVVLLPIALVRGRAFVARHTIHRTIRFQFRREYFSSILLFAGYGFAFLPGIYFEILAEEAGSGAYLQYSPHIFVSTLLTIFLLPLLISLDHRIQIGQLQFGKLEFGYEGGWMRYYGVYIKAFLWFLLYVIVFAFASGILSFIFGIEVINEGVGLVIPILFALLLIALVRGGLTALFWDSIRIGTGGHVKSTLHWRKYGHVLAVNYALTVLSVGLLYPWARVRAYRYVAEHLTIVFDPSTAQIMAASEDISPLAGELTDVSGFDFDFGAV